MTLVPASSHGAATVAQTTDPGATGAGSLWLDTADPGHGVPSTARRLLVRDAANAAWDEIQTIHYDSLGNIRGFLTISDGGIVLYKLDALGVQHGELFSFDSGDHMGLIAGLSRIELNYPGVSGVLINSFWGVTTGGAEYFIRIATPTDASVPTSERIHWFDDTVGSPKLRFKQRDSDGTLTSGWAEAASSITSGALPTVSLVSGTGAQIIVARAAETVTQLATDGTANAATCQVQLSPDNVTYSTLVTVTASVAVNTVGSVTIPVNVRVPAGWYLKMTVSHATLGTTTYY